MTSLTRRIILALGILFLVSLVSCGGAATIPPQGPMPDGGSFTGRWDTNWGPVEMKQEGDLVKGVYQYGDQGIIGIILGKVEGNTLNFVWAEQEGGAGKGRGIFVMGADGSSFQGGWGKEDDDRGGGSWSGTRAQ